MESTWTYLAGAGLSRLVSPSPWRLTSPHRGKEIIVPRGGLAAATPQQDAVLVIYATALEVGVENMTGLEIFLLGKRYLELI